MEMNMRNDLFYISLAQRVRGQKTHLPMTVVLYYVEILLLGRC